MSDGIWLQRVINGRDGFEGFWMCPTPNCSGAGFTFDIFPTDPSHAGNEGWHYFEAGDEESDGEDGEDAEFLAELEAAENGETPAEYDPAEPEYAALDGQYVDDEDWEGEEWKHGLEPGERPSPPPWVLEARQRWEEEQKKYDGPDERPRVIDWADRSPSSAPHPNPPNVDRGDGEIDESDIPF
jgi:hypothetical protein